MLTGQEHGWCLKEAFAGLSVPAAWLLPELYVSLLQEATAREASPEDKSPHGHLWSRGAKLSTCFAIAYTCPSQLLWARPLAMSWLQ